MDDITTYLEAELAKSESELENLRRQAEGVQTRISQLEDIVSGLRHLIGRRSPNRPKFSPVNEWTLLPRTDAVVRILEASDRPLAPKEISKELVAKGRTDDSPNAVSGALSRLKVTGRVQPYGRMRWISGQPNGRSESPNGQANEGPLDE